MFPTPFPIPPFFCSLPLLVSASIVAPVTRACSSFVASQEAQWNGSILYFFNSTIFSRRFFLLFRENLSTHTLPLSLSS